MKKTELFTSALESRGKKHDFVFYVTVIICVASRQNQRYVADSHFPLQAVEVAIADFGLPFVILTLVCIFVNWGSLFHLALFADQSEHSFYL